MATGTILLPVGAATLADGSAGNAAPEIKQLSGSESAPRKSLLTLCFDQATDEHAWWTFQLPAGYASGPIARLLWASPAATATSCVWGARLGAVTPGDADTPLEHPCAAATTVTAAVNTAEARRLTATTITIGQTDGAVAGDLVFLHVYRDADAAADTLAADAELLAVSFEFTTG